jgi:hypothetical protein
MRFLPDTAKRGPMTATIQPRAQALIYTIRERIAQAARVPGLAARHEAIFDIVPALKAQIDELPADDALAADQAMQSLREAFEAFKHDHAIPRLPYSLQIDARYPYRDDSSNAVHIVALRSKQAPNATADSRLAAVQRYIDPGLHDRARAAAYADVMYCRTIGPADLRDAREHTLIGERGAFAARTIRSGECLRVYGGRLMSAATFFSCVEESFVLSANSGNAVAFIDGENILAMANTSLSYDADGIPVAQADDDDGYNMEALTFDASSRCGRHFSIRAFFARRDIEPGAELRWNYRYAPKIVEHVFGGAGRQAQRARANELCSG